MFCVLNIERKSLTLIEKIFKFLARNEYSIRTVPVFKGAPFYILTVKASNNIEWDKVVGCAGKCAKRLLISDNIEMPQIKEIGKFKSTLLYNKAFQNTVLQILKKNLYKNPHSVAILDKNADYTDFTFKLSHLSSTLTVVTENKEKYMNVCDKILESTGLCITLRSDFDNAKIKIDTHRNIISVDIENSFLNITNGEHLLVPDSYKKLLPDGINEYDFFSALYELCGVFSLGECVFETVCVNNEKKVVKDIQFA